MASLLFSLTDSASGAALSRRFPGSRARHVPWPPGALPYPGEPRRRGPPRTLSMLFVAPPPIPPGDGRDRWSAWDRERRRRRTRKRLLVKGLSLQTGGWADGANGSAARFL